jgi:orotate phosphoribosyltransferase
MLDLLKEKDIILYGDFTLKSNKKSNYYVDLRKVISYPSIHKQLCDKIIDKINSELLNNNYNDLVICGTPYGAISYTSYISIKENIPMIFLRKIAKNYGCKKIIEGVYSIENNVILIEDVITTGCSAKQLESQGLKVVLIIAIISRSDNLNLYYNNIPIHYLYHI